MAAAGLAIVIILGGAASLAARNGVEQPVVPLVRLKPADAEMRRLVTDGYTRSVTFRALVDTLHTTDGLVVVQFGLCANGRFRSCVTHIGGDAGARTVRIKINTRATDDRLIATVAHELEHALEILREREVMNADQVLALYRRIGTGRCRLGLSDECETEGALAIEARVNVELAASLRR
jgi:hypothetical protein